MAAARYALVVPLNDWTLSLRRRCVRKFAPRDECADSGNQLILDEQRRVPLVGHFQDFEIGPPRRHGPYARGREHV